MKKELKDSNPVEGNESSFQRFEKLAKRVINVPKKEIEQKPKKSL